MLKIGEFSKMSKLSIKTLRFYETKGILNPAHINLESGYRYYKASQLKLAALIKSLRELDLSIKQISEILSGSDLTEIFRQKAIELNIQKHKIDVSLSIINNYLKEKTMNYKVESKTVPEVLVYSAETTLENYSDAMQWIPAVGAECKELNPDLECAEPPYEFCEFLDCEYKTKNVKVRHSEAVKSIGKENDNIKFRTIPETKVLSIMHQGPYETIGKAYSFILEYAEKNGYEIAGYPRECYIDGIWNKQSPEQWLTEIQLPIK